jgi:hypothetical protein
MDILPINWHQAFDKYENSENNYRQVNSSEFVKELHLPVLSSFDIFTSMKISRNILFMQ